MSRFLRFKNWYLNIGIKEDDKSITKDNARIINVFILFIQFICVVSSIAAVIFKLTPLFYSMIVMIFVLLVVLYAQYKYLYLLSYYLFAGLGCVIVCYISYAIEYTGIHFYVISGLAVASVVYLKKRYHIHFFFILGFFTFLATLWLNENSPNQIDLPRSLQIGWLMFNVLSSFILVYFSGYFYTKSVLKQREISWAANKRVEKELQEKQVLLKEINHRVKNNFQVVSSLVEIQSKAIKDEEALKIIVEGQKRLRAMSLIHQKLYQNDDLRIETIDFVTTLITNIHEAYAAQPMDYEIDIDQQITFDADTSIPLGLVINELITNSFKYAFTDNKDAKLTIKLRANPNNFVLTISDNGPGIENRESFMNSTSVGLRLVKRLVKQLQGKIEYESNHGATFKITFKNSKMRSEID